MKTSGIQGRGVLISKVALIGSRVLNQYTDTVAPCYNEDPVITNNTWKPGRITVKYVETNLAITNPAIWNPRYKE